MKTMFMSSKVIILKREKKQHTHYCNNRSAM